MSNCPICNTPLRTTLFCKVEGYDHMQCQNCQVIYVPKPPTTAELYQSYDSSLRQWIRKIVYAVRPFQSIGRFEESMQGQVKFLILLKPKQV